MFKELFVKAINEGSKWKIKKSKEKTVNKGKTYLGWKDDDYEIRIYNVGDGEFQIWFNLEDSSGNDYSDINGIKSYIKSYAKDIDMEIPTPDKNDIKSLDQVDPMEEF